MKKLEKAFRKIWLALIACCLFALLEYYAPFMEISEKNRSETHPALLIGHRGAAGLAPENTLAALDAALACNTQKIEVDIHRTRDNVLVVMHDSTVNRTTNGNGKIKDLTWAEISSLEAGSHFSPNFSQVKVPSLLEILQKIKSSQATLIIEAKDPKRYPGIAQQVHNLLVQTETQHQAMVISFDIEFIFEFHRIDPAVKIGCLYVFPPRPSAPELSIAKTVSVHWMSNTFFPKRLKQLRADGIETWAWTVNSKRQIERLRRSGFTGIATDFPNL